MSISMPARVLLTLALVCAPLAASSEFYSWTDDDGNVHFGDRPPSSGGAERLENVETLEMRGSAEATSPSRLIVFEKAVRDVKLGKLGLGKDCRTSNSNIPHSQIRKLWHKNRFGGWMHGLLAEQGYRTPPAAPASRGKAPRRGAASPEPEVSIIAVVEGIRFARCAYDTKVTVRWRLFDHAANAVVLEERIDGRAVKRRSAVVQRNMLDAFREAWLDSAEKLVARAEFRRAVSASPAAPSARGDR